jgi:2-amino-4-hydroxy-6-hydroxymethyldihydropteridine diphosphokinase
VTTLVLPDRVVVVGLGGNLGGDAAIVARFVRAREALAAWGSVRGSRVYRSAPIGGPPDQGDYLNAALAVALDPPLPLPAELIAGVLEIERLLGRDRLREVRDGPRPIDLDVLLWGERHARWEGLEVPHPRLAARRFALAPAIDLVGEDVMVPGSSRTLGELWRALPDQRVEPTDLAI